jgi:hypothetical protein
MEFRLVIRSVLQPNNHMRLLLIGNFAPPYDEESLCNFSLLKRLRAEGFDCRIINISERPARLEEGVINTGSYLDFIVKLIRHAWRTDFIHFFTKGYTRLGLLKLALTIFIGKIFRAKTVVTFHSELLSIIGLTRSPFGGQQAVNFSFSRAHRIIFADKDTYDNASVYKTKDNFTLIPSFMDIPEVNKETDSVIIDKLENRKMIIVFSNVSFPSFLFEILHSMVSSQLNPDIGIVVSFSVKPTSKLKHVIEETGKGNSENLIFIEPDNMQMLSQAYKKADVILRTLSCDGKIFFPNFTVSLKKPVRNDNHIYFPHGLLLLKEGKTADLCAYIVNSVLSKETETPEDLQSEDFFKKIKEIYVR